MYLRQFRNYNFIVSIIKSICDGVSKILLGLMERRAGIEREREKREDENLRKVGNIIFMKVDIIFYPWPNFHIAVA